MSQRRTGQVRENASRRGGRWLPTSSLSLCALTALVLLCVCAGTTSAAAHPQAEPSTFRCLRPFSAMNAFVDVAKAAAAQNCDFHYFTVTSASAAVRCAAEVGGGGGGSAAAAGSDATSCNVTLRWSMRRAADVVHRLQRQVGTDADYFTQNTNTNAAAGATTQKKSPRATASSPPAAPGGGAFLTEDDDVWRYTLALRAKGDSTVHYKGYHDGDGYSMCCACLVEGDCVWMAAEQGDNDLAVDEEVATTFSLAQSRLLRGCPLPFATAAAAADADGSQDEDDGAFGAGAAGAHLRVVLTDLDDVEGVEGDGENTGDVFHGEVTKPLHRIVEGPWEATVQMWRRRQLGGTSLDASASASDEGRGSVVEPELLGRVVVPFEVNLAKLRAEGRVTDVVSMALTVDDGGVAEDDHGDL